MGSSLAAKRASVALLLAALLAAPNIAPAQTLPGAAQPGQLNQQLQRPPPPPPPTAPSIALPGPRGPALSAEAAATPIQLTSVVIEGGTLYPARVLDAMAAPLLNRPTTLGALFDLAAAITAKYRADGYILSRVVTPAQRIEHGVAHIRIIEGYIDEVTVEGPHDAHVAAYARRIKASRPLRVADLERFLLLANDLPGVRVRAVVAPSNGPAGAADLHLIVSRTAIDGSVGADNFGSRFFGPYEWSAAANFNGILGADERTALRFGAAVPFEAMHYFQAQEDVPLGNDGLVLSAGVVVNIGRPGFTLKPFDPSTKGVSASLRLTYPIIRSRAMDWRVWADLDSFDGRSVLNHTPSLPPSSNDSIRSLRLGMSYDSIDALGGSNYARIEFSQGIPALGASSNRRPNPSRPGGRTDYEKLTIDVERTQSLAFLMRGASLYFSGTAQTGFRTGLLAPEQLGVGGTQFGRGYDPSEITGDDGAAATVELRRAIAIALPRGVPLLLQPYAFYDTGFVETLNSVTVDKRTSLASTGFGLRALVDNRVTADLVFAKPLTRVPEQNSLIGEDDKPWRICFSVSVNF